MLHFVLKIKIWMTKSHRGHLFFHYKCFQIIKRSQETHQIYDKKKPNYWSTGTETQTLMYMRV